MKHRLLTMAVASGIAMTFVTAANAHADIGVYFGAAPVYEPPPVVYAPPPPPPVIYQPAPVYVSPPVEYGGYWHHDHDRDWEHGRGRGWHHGWHHEDDD